MAAEIQEANRPWWINRLRFSCRMRTGLRASPVLRWGIIAFSRPEMLLLSSYSLTVFSSNTLWEYRHRRRLLLAAFSPLFLAVPASSIAE